MKLVVSDIHLGSEASEAKLFFRFLESIDPAAHLIVNGDLIDNYNFKKFKKSHWKVLNAIRDWKNKTLIAGNHEESAEKASLLLGMDFVDHVSFEDCGKRFFITHGHTWDDFLGKFPLIEYVGDFIYGGLQRLDPEHKIAKQVKRTVKKFIKCIDKVAKGALSLDYDGVVAGHTHYPTHISFHNRNYYNSGCWVEKPGTYVTINKGIATLHSGEAIL
jgi:UDP-2,3-diacylglucosamine pyrophosphatase LpxH